MIPMQFSNAGIKDYEHLIALFLVLISFDDVMH